MSRKTTIYDIARYLKISPASVSYVINGVDKVSKETKERVLAAIKELGYAKNSNAVYLSVLYSSTWSDQHKTTALGKVDNVELNNILVIDGKIRSEISISGCIDPRSGYSKEVHYVSNVSFIDFSLYGNKIDKSYTNYHETHANNVSFTYSGKEITGHVFSVNDVTNYGNNIDFS